MELQGKVALVTGGGTGLGREVSLLFAREGANVAINYTRSTADAESTVKDLCALGVKAIAVKADVSRASEVKAMVDQVLEAFGRVDVLVNNAGCTVFVDFQNLEGVAEEDWDRIMAVNVKGAFLCSRAVAPTMKSLKNGRIINITSVSGLREGGSSIPYAVSKAGETMLTRCLAQALAPEIQVNAIAPGLMDTRWGRLWGDEVLRRGAQATALQRLPTVPDIAAAVLFLAKNDSITGQSLVVDAGRVLH